MPGRGVILSPNGRPVVMPSTGTMPQVDWSHPMASHLEHLIIRNFDIARGGRNLAAVKSATVGRERGPANHITSGGSGAATESYFDSPNNLAVQDLTAWVLFTRTGNGTSGSYAWLFSKATTVSTRELDLAMNSSGQITYVNAGDVGNASVTIGSIPDGSTKLAGFSRSGTTASVYIDGVFVNTVSSMTGTTSSGSAAKFYLGHAGNNNNGFGQPGDYITGGVALRSFSNVEWASLAQDPYQMMRF